MSSLIEKRSKAIDEFDCVASLCRSTKHGDLLNAMLTKRGLTFEEIIVYCSQFCGTCQSVVDTVGRNLLHMASSRGLNDVLEWLIERRHADIDVKDKESGYTALHRSVFYGQLHTAITLIKHGANVQMLDHDFLTYLDIVMKDRNDYITYDIKHDCEVYMWGTNSNYTLGLQEAKKHPECLSKQNLDAFVKQVH